MYNLKLQTNCLFAYCMLPVYFYTCNIWIQCFHPKRYMLPKQLNKYYHPYKIYIRLHFQTLAFCQGMKDM